MPGANTVVSAVASRPSGKLAWHCKLLYHAAKRVKQAALSVASRSRTSSRSLSACSLDWAIRRRFSCWTLRATAVHRRAPVCCCPSPRPVYRSPATLTVPFCPEQGGLQTVPWPGSHNQRRVPLRVPSCGTRANIGGQRDVGLARRVQKRAHGPSRHYRPFYFVLAA